MMDIGDVKKVIDNVAQKPFLCSDTEIETQNGYIITTKAHYDELLIAKRKETLAEFHRERTDSGSVRYAEQQISMDITTAISADRDGDGKIHYKIRKGNKNVRSVHKKPKEKLLVQIWRELYMHKLR